jgi:hypothetical protein
MMEYWTNESVGTDVRHWENRHLACSFSAQAGCLCSQYRHTDVSKNILPLFPYSNIPVKL